MLFNNSMYLACQIGGKLISGSSIKTIQLSSNSGSKANKVDKMLASPELASPKLNSNPPFLYTLTS